MKLLLCSKYPPERTNDNQTIAMVHIFYLDHKAKDIRRARATIAAFNFETNKLQGQKTTIFLFVTLYIVVAAAR